MTIPYMNATQPWEIMPYLNSITGGWFTTFIVICIWIVSFMALSNLTPKHGFTAATFLTFIISLIFFFMEALPLTAVIALAFCLGLSVIINMGRSQ